MSTSAANRSSDGRVTRWAGQRELRRRAFVDAALRAIEEHGAEVSTEQIARAAGVARTQIYKHFAGATDLQRAIADRAVEKVTADLAPLWQLHGTPREMIDSAIRSHTAWLSDHNDLYRYLRLHAATARGDRDAITDVKTAIARHLTLLFEHYLTVFGVDTRAAEPVAFGVVGLVDCSTARWLDSPRDLEYGEFAGLLTRWVWLILDDLFRAGGIELDPDTPLDTPNLTFPPSDSPTPASGTPQV
jgi:AcrR family transcriptional regulator